MSLSVRSTLFSLFIHAVGVAVLCVVPLSVNDRFHSAGRQHVIAMELSRARPATLDSPVMTVHAPDLETPSVIEPATWSRRVRSVPDVSSETEDRLAPPPDVPEVAPARDAAFEPAQAAEVVTVDPPVPPRPRSTLASQYTPPAVDRIPIPQPVGWSRPTPADFSSNPPPRYPIEAARRGMEGTVMLRLHVDTDGQVVRVEIIESSGHRSLDQAAVDAVKQWKGQPAQRFGLPVVSEEVLPVRFRL